MLFNLFVFPNSMFTPLLLFFFNWKGYDLSGEIALKNNHYYYYIYIYYMLFLLYYYLLLVITVIISVIVFYYYYLFYYYYSILYTFYTMHSCIMSYKVIFHSMFSGAQNVLLLLCRAGFHTTLVGRQRYTPCEASSDKSLSLVSL